MSDEIIDPNKKIDEARRRYAAGYYQDKLEQGRQFQDIVTRALYQRGIVVVGYASRRFQKSHGENMLGAEIKNDTNFRKTHNLYIEVAEKSHPDNPEFVPSGIQRRDNSWLYVIGDEKTIWIFSTKHLRKLVKSCSWRQVTTPTSIGYLLPVAEADDYCIRKLELSR